MRLRYEIVDVFTDHPYAGNPLAVVLGAERLDGVQMQSVAREFNLSETAFVLPADDGADYRIRIFTPGKELPFAGHPSVGAAVTLARLGMIEPGERVQQCGAGMLPVTVEPHRATLTGGTPAHGEPLDPAPLLAAVGLAADDFLGPPPRVAGCGIAFYHLSVRPDAVARAVPEARLLRELGQEGVVVCAWDPQRAVSHARVFCDAVGVTEDPATGSAALGFGVWLAASGLVGDGTTAYTVKQGAELHRPSTLDCTVTVQDGAVLRATVAGAVAPVGSGELAVPPFIG